jgi:hypothetical protein
VHELVDDGLQVERIDSTKPVGSHAFGGDHVVLIPSAWPGPVRRPSCRPAVEGLQHDRRAPLGWMPGIVGVGDSSTDRELSPRQCGGGRFS